MRQAIDELLHAIASIAKRIECEARPATTSDLKELAEAIAALASATQALRDLA